MNKRNLITKITSRKFIFAIVGFVAMLLTAFKFSTETVAQITELIMGALIIISYIIAEAWTDTEKKTTDEDDDIINEKDLDNIIEKMDNENQGE